MGHVFGFRQRRKHNLPSRRARPQTTKETYFGLCNTSLKLRYKNHTSSFGNERCGNATRILSKRFWTKLAFLVARTVSEVHFGEAFYRQNVAIPPLRSSFEYLYIQANPQFIGTFATIHLALSTLMDQRLVLKIILSPFKTRKRELKQNIGRKNCFVVLRFIGSLIKKLPLRMGGK